MVEEVTPTEPASKKVEDKNIIESLFFLKENKLMKESKSTIKFSTVKEAEDSAKEEIVGAISEKLNPIKQDISELQKAGYELKLYGIELLRIPLKTKVWKATTLKKDLEEIFQTLIKVEKVTNELMKEKEQKIIEKEKREKEKEDQEAIDLKNKKPIIEPIGKSSPIRPVKKEESKR